ncbi:plasmid replication initiator TrfA [Rhizobacter sp. SG703]|uniref:plasmid replication initiator TrfA n=1 Tax=Rhizobacter sp. SG703 TaxID=2587140 RepID=UPI0014456586|nr:plasmid replication initiator TrfA [Rhizobacter sp. SG703]NKI93906.1 hypothetical protein [Rhizobacter sp. SG703]
MQVRGKKNQLDGLTRELENRGRFDGDSFREVQHLLAEVEHLEEAFARDFLPQHTQRQLLSPRNFFTGRLFHVKGRNVPRAPSVEFALDAGAIDGPRYVGPELRQGDGLVFMALLNLCRDYRVGKQACFGVAAMTKALWGVDYNGQLRKRLKQTIQRLQRATIEFSGFTVQLVQRFEHPARGEWSVALDRDIVQLFHLQQEVWLDLSLRLRLSEGLTTWLYGYIRSQSRLIPWSIDNLRERCGSDAHDKAFRDTLRTSLSQLAREGVIDSGWSLKGRMVHWRKPLTDAASTRQQAQLPAPQEQASLLPCDQTIEQVLRPRGQRS